MNGMTRRARLRERLPYPIRWLLLRRYFWNAYRSGEWELRELGRLVDRSRGAVDVGGNNGVYTYHLSRLVPWVCAFEPNPVLAANLIALKLRNVTVEQAALSDAPGSADLRVPYASGVEDTGMASLEATAVSCTNLARVIPVELRTLDSYGLSPGIIKIDVEGHEEAVLRGALETVRAHRPALLIEIEERHNAGGLERIAALLSSENYLGYFFDRGLRRSLSEFRIEQHQVVTAALQDGNYASRRTLSYVNNFLFVQKR